jgi:hypothetical protein
MIQPGVTIRMTQTHQVHRQLTDINDLTLSNYDQALLQEIRNLLTSQPTYRAGGISRKLRFWKQLTSDRNMLDIIEGFTLAFEFRPPTREIAQQLLTSAHDIEIASELLQDLLEKQVIETTDIDPTGYVSNIFLREKSSGGHRLILNLKSLNNYVEYYHFKMDNLNTAISLTFKNCWFTSLDLSDAYYSVNVLPQDRKYLQFHFQGTSYRFTCMANGITSAPRTFTINEVAFVLSQRTIQFNHHVLSR